MVRKRVRDAEVLPEAPQNGADKNEDSGSDDVCLLIWALTPPQLTRGLGRRHDKCRIRVV